MLVLATYNRSKVQEFLSLFSDLYTDIQSLEHFAPKVSFIESGTTYAQNAAIKAELAASISGHISLADDSGLEVDALYGAPGIFSARYAGSSATDADRISRLLHELEGVPNEQRTARFRCVLCLFLPSIKKGYFFEGTVEGQISEARRGTAGFGYDPVFIPTRPSSFDSTDDSSFHAKTIAQLPVAVKQKISHRAKAVAHMHAFIREHEPLRTELRSVLNSI